MILCIFSKTYKLRCSMEGGLYWCKYPFSTFLVKWRQKILTILKSFQLFFHIPVSTYLDLKHANCIIFVLQLSTFLAWRQLFASHTIIIFNWGTLSCYFAHGRAASFALWPDNPNLVQKVWTIYSTKTSQNLALILKTFAKHIVLVFAVSSPKLTCIGVLNPL